MQGLGQGASAPQMAQGSTAWGAVGTGVGAVSNVIQGLGQQQQYNYLAQVASNNAAITRANAQATASAGTVTESYEKARTTAAVAQQKVGQAASGVDVNVGSPVASREATQTVGNLDAAMIHYNTARSVYGLESEAGQYDAQAGLDKLAGRNSVLSGIAKAGTTVLGGAQSLSGKWAQYRTAFGSAN